LPRKRLLRIENLTGNQCVFFASRVRPCNIEYIFFQQVPNIKSYWRLKISFLIDVIEINLVCMVRLSRLLWKGR
jgi:hypothetical protein